MKRAILYDRFVLVHIRSKDDALLLIHRDAINKMVKHIATERFALQAKHINVLTAIHMDALPGILCHLLERTSVEHGIDGAVCYLNIAESHDAGRDAIALGNFELRLTVRTNAHCAGAVFQMIDFEHLAKLCHRCQDTVTRIVIDEAAPCLRQCRTGIL